MAARRVLITVPHTYRRDAPYLRRLEAAGLEVERRIGRHGKLTEDELREALPGVFATLASSEPYTERVFRTAPDLRVVARWGVGFDAIDVDAIRGLEEQLHAFVETRHGSVLAAIVEKKQLDDDIKNRLNALLKEFVTDVAGVKAQG